MAGHFWLFLSSVWVHWAPLLTGGLFSILMLIVNKPIRRRYVIWVMATALFISCFLAWRDQYASAEWRGRENYRLSAIIAERDKQPPVTPPAKEHTRLNFLVPSEVITNPFLPLHKDEIAAFNTAYTNGGDFPVLDATSDGRVVIVSLDQLNNGAIFSNYRNHLNPLHITGGTLNPHTGGQAFHSFYSPSLTEKDTSGLIGGNMAICVLGVAWWHDDTGRYETDSGYCFLAEGNGYTWHVLPENNREMVRP